MGRSDVCRLFFHPQGAAGLSSDMMSFPEVASPPLLRAIPSAKKQAKEMSGAPGRRVQGAGCRSPPTATRPRRLRRMLNVEVPPTPDVISILTSVLAHTTLMESEEFENTYDVGEELGKGGWASVFSATLRRPHTLSAFPLAVKVLDKMALGQLMDVRHMNARLRDECRVLAELTHPHVVRLREICESPRHVFIVMERATGGALLEKILDRGCFAEPDAQCVMSQLLDVLRFMHSHGVVHRDIKPENILLDASSDGWNIKVTDFGLVKIFSDQDDLAHSLPASKIGSRLASIDPVVSSAAQMPPVLLSPSSRFSDAYSAHLP